MLRKGRVGPYIQMVQLMSWRHGVFFSQWNKSISCHAIFNQSENYWGNFFFLLVEIDQSGSRLTNQWGYFVSKCSNVIGSEWGILIGCWVWVGSALFVSCDPVLTRLRSCDWDNGDCLVPKIEIPLCGWIYLSVYGPCMIVPHKWTKICW